MTSIAIPNGVTYIWGDTFAYCTALSSVTIPNSVTCIWEYAFDGCTALTNVYYTGTEEEWDRISIDNSNDPLFTATIHFNAVIVTNVLDLPAELTVIESGAFTGLDSADAVRIPAGVTSIADDAFDPGMTLIVPSGSPWAQWAADRGYGVAEE